MAASGWVSELQQKADWAAVEEGSCTHGTQSAGSAHTPSRVRQTEPEQGKRQKCWDSDLAFLGYILKPAQLKVLLVPHWGSSQCIYIHTLIYYAVISPSWKLWGQFISVLEHPDKFNMLNVFQLAQLHIPHRQTISMRSIYNWNHLGAFHRIHDTLLAYSFCCCCSLKVIALIEIKSKLLF